MILLGRKRVACNLWSLAPFRGSTDAVSQLSFHITCLRIAPTKGRIIKLDYGSPTDSPPYVMLAGPVFRGMPALRIAVRRGSPTPAPRDEPKHTACHDEAVEWQILVVASLPAHTRVSQPDPRARRCCFSDSGV
jgi:hypothetical protein